MLKKVKEFLHPSNVTWMQPKKALKSTLVTLSVVLIAGIFTVCADALLGFLFSIIM